MCIYICCAQVTHTHPHSLSLPHGSAFWCLLLQHNLTICRSLFLFLSFLFLVCAFLLSLREMHSESQGVPAEALKTNSKKDQFCMFYPRMC